MSVYTKLFSYHLKRNVNFNESLLQLVRSPNLILLENNQGLIDTDFNLFFKSIRGTLNHIYFGELVWLMRLLNKSSIEVNYEDLDQSIKSSKHCIETKEVSYIKELLNEKNIDLNLSFKFDYSNISKLWESDSKITKIKINQFEKTYSNIFEYSHFTNEQNEYFLKNHLIRMLINDILFNKFISNLVKQKTVNSNEIYVEYFDTKGAKKSKDVELVLFHMINHSTHHLSQISNLFIDKSKIKLDKDLLNSVYPISDIPYYF